MLPICYTNVAYAVVGGKGGRQRSNWNFYLPSTTYLILFPSFLRKVAAA